MKRWKIGWWVCCGLSFAALQSAAAATDAHVAKASTNAGIASPMVEAEAATHSPAAETSDSTANAPKTAAREQTTKGPRKSKRLRFRGPDGTCACDCASGGISEADIRKSQEARRTTSR